MSHRCALLLAVALSACAPVTPQPPAVTASTAQAAAAGRAHPVAQQARLFRVAYPLLRAARDRCRDSSLLHAIGLLAANRYGLGQYEALGWQLGIDERLQVLAVAAESPAARGGIVAGDVITAMNGTPAPRTAPETQAFALHMARLVAAREPVELELQRPSGPVAVVLDAEPICGYQVQIADTAQVNARTDGRRTIHVSRGMLEFARSDAELALVIAHEIAHNALGHLDVRAEFLRSLNVEGAPVFPGSLQGATPALLQALEMEADHLGLYLVARAGLATAEAPAFIARLGGLSATGPQAQTHPASAARAAALRRTVADIEDKRARGLPLQP